MRELRVENYAAWVAGVKSQLESDLFLNKLLTGICLMVTVIISIGWVVAAKYGIWVPASLAVITAGIAFTRTYIRKNIALLDNETIMQRRYAEYVQLRQSRMKALEKHSTDYSYSNDGMVMHFALADGARLDTDYRVVNASGDCYSDGYTCDSGDSGSCDCGGGDGGGGD